MVVEALRRVSAGGWERVRSRREVGIAASLAFAAPLVGVFVWRADLGGLGERLRDVDVGILAGAAAFYFLNVWFQAFRWHLLIRHLGSPGPLSLFPPMTVGIMGNNLLPLRMGMLLRAEYLRARYALKAPAVLTTIVVEGWLDGLVLAVVFLPVLAVVGTEEGILRAVLLSGGVAAAALLAVRILYTERWGRLWRGRRLPLPPLLPEGARSRLGPLVESFLSGLTSVKSGRVLFLAAALTAGGWLVRAAELYLVGLALHLDQSFPDFLVLTAALSASGIAHISPGNTGPYEVVAAEVLRGLGAGPGAASAYAIVSHAVLFIPVTLVGLGFFVWHRLTANGPQQVAGASSSGGRGAEGRARRIPPPRAR